MNSKVLTVLAHVRSKPGKEGQVRQELLSLIEPSRKDKGCLNYDLHESLEKPGVFLFHENWTSKSDLDTHLQQSHVQRALGQLANLADAEITLWEKIR